jgi:uncharacterized protein involved in exopolysaccharide biosynthesis
MNHNPIVNRPVFRSLVARDGFGTPSFAGAGSSVLASPYGYGGGMASGGDDDLQDDGKPSRGGRRGWFALHKGWFAGVTLFIWCWTLIFALFVHQPKFTSASTVVIKDSAITERYVDQKIGTEEYKTTSSNASNPVLNTMGLLKSARVSNAVFEYFQKNHPEELQRLKLTSLQDWQDYFGDGTKFIKSKNLPGTDLISLSFSWPGKPELAHDAMAAIVNAFQQASLDLNRDEQKHRRDYLERQVTDINQKLAAVRARKAAFKRSVGTINLASETEALAEARIEMSNQAAIAAAQQSGKQAESSRIKNILGMNPTEAMRAVAVGRNESVSKLEDQLYALQEQYSNLRATLTEKNPRVKQVKMQIEQVQRDIDRETSRTFGTAGTAAAVASTRRTGIVADETRGDVIRRMAESQAESENFSRQAGSLSSYVAKLDQRIHFLSEVEEKLAAIEQEEGILSGALTSVNQKSIEAQLKEAEAQSNVFVVDPPTLPLKASFPTQAHVILIGLIAGLAAGAAAGFIGGRSDARSWLPGSRDEFDSENGEGGAYMPNHAALFGPGYAAALPPHEMAAERYPALTQHAQHLSDPMADAYAGSLPELAAAYPATADRASKPAPQTIEIVGRPPASSADRLRRLSTLDPID